MLFRLLPGPRLIAPVLSLCLWLGAQSAQTAEPLFREDFDRAGSDLPQNLAERLPERGGVVHVLVGSNTATKGQVVTLPVPIERVRGQRVYLGADVKIQNVSPKPNAWNGVKVMLIIETPSGRSYPQAEIPVGTADWRRYSAAVSVPEDATSAQIVLGLEQVTGEAWFDNLRIVQRTTLTSVLKEDPFRPVFRGHGLPRLRGAMAGNSLTAADVKHFGTVWKGNLLRLQIFESARQDRSLEDYDRWLDERLEYIDRVLKWCGQYGVKAVIDLHSPPGGQAFSAGYITARGRIFTDPAAQAKFVAVWEKMTRRYQGNPVVWGFDLVNEPDDSMVTEQCLDWNTLADKTARAVRAIDPERTLIIEPNGWGGADAFASFLPLDLPNVVYSFHFYQPMQFTHQGIQGNPSGVNYPGVVGSENWDKARLERAMRPAIDFAQRYRVHMYVGEFSAIRIAPAGSAAKYLGDVIDILEQHGFDWSYHAYREWHGWSLEHEGSLEKPVTTSNPPDRQQVVLAWFAKNLKP